MPAYLFSARNLRAGAFGDDTDSARYLIVPDDDAIKVPDGSHVVPRAKWLDAVIPQPPLQASDKSVPNRQVHNADILIYIHGYNDSEGDILNNHRSLKEGLSRQGYKGQLVSFDWPCGNTPLAYLGDRHKARQTAMELVDSGIALLAARQSKECTVNVHVLAHSTGAFVVREAFDDADNANKLATPAWMVSQLLFISGDVSSASMGAGERDSYAVYKHSVRFTNYHNPYDVALALSNVKRAGFENRVGRVGLPAVVPANAVDVNCGPYYKSICDRSKDPFYSHSWYFTDPLFMYDLCHTLGGLTDRAYMDSRSPAANGTLLLTPLPGTV